VNHTTETYAVLHTDLMATIDKYRDMIIGFSYQVCKRCHKLMPT
jgi:hypothetical protein